MSERSDARVALSVLVPVKNEAANLRDCLASVSFAEEIVVVDSTSTDGTTAIAEAVGARVVQFVWNGKFPRKKNWALENVLWQNEWILIVDADERVTPQLEREIREAIRRTDMDGFYLNRRFWFLGGWINHCGYFPSWNLRLFRHRLGRYEQIEIGDNLVSGDNEVHEHVLLNEAAASEKLHERAGETTLRATPFGTAVERKRWLKKLAMKAPFRPSLRFFYHYVWKQGFRDGYRGWVLCRLLAWYERMILLKERETTARSRITSYPTIQR